MTDQDIIDKQAVKIDAQRDKLDDKSSEIQKLHDRMEFLDENDRTNAVEHKMLFDQNKKMLELVEPMSETFNTIRILGKWVAAVVVFLGILGGAIWTFINIFDRVKK